MAVELADSKMNFRHLTLAWNGSFVFFLGRVGVMVNAGVSLFTQLDEMVGSCVHIDQSRYACLFVFVPSHLWMVLGAGKSVLVLVLVLVLLLVLLLLLLLVLSVLPVVCCRVL